MLWIWGCSGGAPLTDAQLNATVESESDSLAECAGVGVEELIVTISVAPDGQVEDARASGSPRVSACVERVIKTWTFPTATSGVEASLPLTITPAPVPSDEEGAPAETQTD